MKARPYESSDLDATLDLLRLSMGESQVTPRVQAFWEWKHDLNPFGRSYRLLATEEDQLIGLRAFMRWTFETQEETVTAVRAVDTATHPEHRRKGLFSKLTRQALEDVTAEGVDLVFNTPNEKSLPGYLKLGWEVVTRWPLYVKPLKPVRLALGVLKSKLGSSPPPGTFVPQPPLERWRERNLASRRKPEGLRTPRTDDYLNWRYGGHPTVTYYTFENEGGLAVLRPNLRFGLQELVLVELFPRDLQMLLGGLVREARGDYLIAHFAEGSPELAALRRAGFLKAPGQGMVFTTRLLNEELARARQPASWDLSLGDLELF